MVLHSPAHADLLFRDKVLKLLVEVLSVGDGIILRFRILRQVHIVAVRSLNLYIRLMRGIGISVH